MTRQILFRTASQPRDQHGLAHALLTIFLTTLLTALLASPLQADSGDEDERQVHRIRVERGPAVSCDQLDSDQVAAYQRVRRGFLGVETTELSDDLLVHFGVAADGGVMISKIVDDSAAQRAGLQVGDVITRMDGYDLHGPWQLGKVVRERGGQTVNADVWRDGKLQVMSITLGSRETCTLDMSTLLEGLDLSSDLHLEAEELARLGAEMGALGATLSADVLREVTEAMQAIDWEEQMSALEALEEVESERMVELQERLRELEARLEEEFEHFDEDYERALEERMRLKEQALHERQKRIEIELRAKEEAMRRGVERQRAEAEARAHEAQRAAEAAERRAAEEAAAEGGGGLLL